MTDPVDPNIELARLIRGELPYDYIGLWSVVVSARRLLRGATGEQVLRLVLDTILQMLAEGDIVVGYPSGGGRLFAPWTSEPAESIREIEREWLKLARDPDIGEIVWLAGVADLEVA